MFQSFILILCRDFLASTLSMLSSWSWHVILITIMGILVVVTIISISINHHHHHHGHRQHHGPKDQHATVPVLAELGDQNVAGLRPNIWWNSSAWKSYRFSILAPTGRHWNLTSADKFQPGHKPGPKFVCLDLSLILQKGEIGRRLEEDWKRVSKLSKGFCIDSLLS